MKSTQTFTSTISPHIIAWVDKVAREKKKTRRAVLEEAIRHYQKNTARESLKEGFKRAAKDDDMLELAEWGLKDYSDLVSRS